MGPTETSIAPRQRPKAANSNVLPLANTVTPVKMTVPSAPVSNGQKGILNKSSYSVLTKWSDGTFRKENTKQTLALTQ